MTDSKSERSSALRWLSSFSWRRFIGIRRQRLLRIGACHRDRWQPAESCAWCRVDESAQGLHRALAASSFQRFGGKHSAPQLSPRVVTLVDDLRRACGLGSRSVCRSVLLHARRRCFFCIIQRRHDARASWCFGSQHAVIPDKMNAWSRDQRSAPHSGTAARAAADRAPEVPHQHAAPSPRCWRRVAADANFPRRHRRTLPRHRPRPTPSRHSRPQSRGTGGVKRIPLRTFSEVRAETRFESPLCLALFRVRSAAWPPFSTLHAGRSGTDALLHL